MFADASEDICVGIIIAVLREVGMLFVQGIPLDRG